VLAAALAGEAVRSARVVHRGDARVVPMEIPQHKDDETHRRTLADAIERRSDEIIARWLDRTRVDAGAHNVPVTDLRDGIHMYLTRLAELLRQSESVGSAGTSAWVDVAREHALARVRLGFDVSQLFHELVLLRDIATEVLREEGALTDVDQLERLIALIDPAVASSIELYVNSRDFSARRAEAEHIGFLTHELRNPLGAVTLAAEQLRDSGLSEVQRQKLSTILDKNLLRLRRLIDDVLLTERLEVGEVECRPTETSLGNLVDDTLETMRRAGTQKGLTVEAHYDPGLQLYADHDLTLSALEHLLENALKYSDTGTIEFTVEERSDELAFHVRDNCDGLSPEELRVIFEPFKRAHTNKPGTGLGLAIARRAVEAQGGKIYAESASDRGCHFCFTLPKTHH
jgi:signal transduction histidine kinase